MSQTNTSDEDWYSINPPTNTRHTKRTKERSKQKYHKTDTIEKNRHRRSSGQNIPSQGRCSNTVTCSVSDSTCHVNVDLDASEIEAGGHFEQPLSAKKRKDTMKNFTTSRAYDRDLKLSSSDLASMDAPAVQMQTMSVDTSDRFMCLNPKLVPQTATDETQSDSTCQQTMSVDTSDRFMCLNPKLVPQTATDETQCDSTCQKPVTPPMCPKDRIMFYKTFSLLINLGNLARKEKESKTGPYSRQLSCEQEVWQNKVNDLIWLELQAWYSGRTLKLQDQFLYEERENVTVVLDEVMNFKVTPDDLTGRWTDVVPCGAVSESGDNNGISVVCNESRDSGGVTKVSPEGETSVQNSDPVSRPSDLHRASDSDMAGRLGTCLDGCMLECAQTLAEMTTIQKEALVQVSAVLDQLDAVEHLYPTTKALGKDYPLYDTPEFQQRVDTLCLWMNIVKDLGHKLQLMAKVLHVDTIDGLQWPWLDIALNTQRETKDCTTVSESNSESDMSVTHMPSDSGKNVRFNLSETSLTDTAAVANDLQHQTSMNSNCRTSVEDICLTHIYRHFVDRTLKKTGMRKLLLRLIRLTSGTLQRAKEALQKPKTTPSYADVVVQEVSVF